MGDYDEQAVALYRAKAEKITSLLNSMADDIKLLYSGNRSIVGSLRKDFTILRDLFRDLHAYSTSCTSKFFNQIYFR
jgi:hypothetical protein